MRELWKIDIILLNNIMYFSIIFVLHMSNMLITFKFIGIKNASLSNTKRILTLALFFFFLGQRIINKKRNNCLEFRF